MTLRAALIALGFGMLTAVAAVFIGRVPVHWAILIGLPVATIVLLSLMLSGVYDADWTAAPELATASASLQASTLADRLAEATDNVHRFHTRVRPRLQRLALATLRRRPDTMDLTGLDDPRARAALGEELHTLLTSPAATLPSPRRLTMLLRRLED